VTAYNPFCGCERCNGTPAQPGQSVPHTQPAGAPVAAHDTPTVRTHELRGLWSVAATRHAIDERIKSRREDSEFQTRLRRLIQENRESLERLAK
jgi:hypothetical protein